MRKVLEILVFLELGIFETLGSKISHGASKKIADVPIHLREVYKRYFLIEGHHMVAFLMPFNLSKHSQARMREVEMSLYRNM